MKLPTIIEHHGEIVSEWHGEKPTQGADHRDRE
jgi:hypothetical protein